MELQHKCFFLLNLLDPAHSYGPGVIIQETPILRQCLIPNVQQPPVTVIIKYTIPVTMRLPDVDINQITDAFKQAYNNAIVNAALVRNIYELGTIV
jgi:hypothetical protein